MTRKNKGEKKKK